MDCKKCPYGKDDFERRMSWYNKIIEERGIPNDVYHDLQPEDAADEFEQFLWCDKVGGKVYCFGHCSDFYDSEITNFRNTSKQKKRNKRERDIKHKKHLKRLCEISNYPPPVYYTAEIYVKGRGFVENPKPYYKRIYRKSLSKFLKRQSNKKIRKYKGELHHGNMCHKLYEFWWQYD